MPQVAVQINSPRFRPDIKITTDKGRLRACPERLKRLRLEDQSEC